MEISQLERVNTPKGEYLSAKITKKGLEWREPEGTADDMKELNASYEHLKALRAEAIKLGIVPPPEKWGALNQHLARA